MPPKDAKEYYRVHRKERVSYTRRYRKENNRKIKRYMKNWRSRNKNQISVYNKEYRRTYRDRIYSCSIKDLEKKQKHRCGICGKKKVLVVDHDHECCGPAKSCGECVRGLLCRPCNYLLGHAYDRIEILRKAINYLRGFSK
jgi:hypothetical protein